MKRSIFLSVLMAVLILLAFAITFTGCTDVTYNIDNTTTAPPVETADQFQAINSAFASYLGSGAGPVTKASDLFDMLNDGDASNDPVVISVRAASAYEAGHIPGAINIPWREIAKTSSLAKIPTGRNIVVTCYTGHTAGVATTVLNSLGYTATNMKFGMMSWTQDPVVRVQGAFTEGVDSHDFPTETTINTLPPSQALPVVDYTSSQESYEIIRAAADAYAGGEKGPVIKAQDLFDNINDGDPSNDPIILSVRSEDSYNIGHVPGAINIPWRSIASVDELKVLPVGREIVVYCYTGHTAGIATTALNMMGYNAKNMKFGIMSWTTDPTVRVQGAFTEGVDSHDYAVNAGPNP